MVVTQICLALRFRSSYHPQVNGSLLHVAAAVLLAAGAGAATGKTVWQKERKVTQSWASPIIVISGDREMVVLAENPTATAYDVNTGEAILSTECLGGEVAPSPAYAGDTLIVANEQAELSAISLATGKIAWSGEDNLPDVASPLATEQFVFTADSSGVVNCYTIRTGRKLWTREFDEPFYPSPILLPR